MIFTALPLDGLYLVTPEPVRDQRGFNARLWCEREFRDRGIDFRIVQMNMIGNGPAGTLRGFHYQAPPHAESKLFSVRRGAIHDVVVDVRRGSPTYLQWTGVRLTAEGREQLFIPKGCAQGFQTLVPETEVLYSVSAAYAPGHERGFRHDDPAFGIEWPLPVSAISEKDRSWPDFREETA